MKNMSIGIVSILLVATAALVANGESQSAATSHKIPLKHNITLEMAVAPFDAAKHRVTECEIMGSKLICLIDDKPVFGTDWGLPKSKLIKAAVKIGPSVVDLDVSCMFNPWFSKPDPRDFTADSVYGGYRIRGNFSDAAGSYKAEWLIIQNSSVRTQLANVEQ